MNPLKLRFDPLPSEYWMFYQQLQSRNPIDAAYFLERHAKEIALGEEAVKWCVQETARVAAETAESVRNPDEWLKVRAREGDERAAAAATLARQAI